MFLLCMVKKRSVFLTVGPRFHICCLDKICYIIEVFYVIVYMYQFYLCTADLLKHPKSEGNYFNFQLPVLKYLLCNFKACLQGYTHS
jgi:hypothetical protein